MEPSRQRDHLDGANRLAGHFLAASVDASQQGDFWSKAGSNILSQLLLAAALDERPITDIMQWLAFPADRTPLDILRDHDFAAVAAQLKGTVEGPLKRGTVSTRQPGSTPPRS